MRCVMVLVALAIAGCSTGTGGASARPALSAVPSVSAAITPAPLQAPSLGPSLGPAASVGPVESSDVLSSTGRIDLALSGEPSWIPHAGDAACQTAPLGRDVAEITGLDLGTLEGGLMRATVSLEPTASGALSASLQLWIADAPDGATQPFWEGAAKETEIGPGSRSGHATFSKLPLAIPDKVPAPTAVPATLTGQIDWSCDPLASANAAIALSVSDVLVTMAPDGTSVLSVALGVNVHANRDARLDTSIKLDNPSFTLRPPGGLIFDAPNPSTVAEALTGGTDTMVDLLFQSPQAHGTSGIVLASTYLPAKPGTWTLTAIVYEADGAVSIVDADVRVEPADVR